MAPTQLPIQLTNFIGREHDLSSVERILSATRLVTLIGVGGCGKTRLAIKVANQISQTFPDGVWFADLASLREPSLVPQFILEALGVNLVANQPLLVALKNHLRSKRLLLVLDNCEHLKEPCAELAQQLLSYAPELRILATSREPLVIAGEAIYPVTGLDWPKFDREDVQAWQNNPNILEIMKFDAVHLFVEPLL